MPDAHKNFAISAVVTAPSPATSGTSLVVTTGQGTRFPAVPFNAVICPAATAPTPENAEVVRVTTVATDTLTIVRAQEGSTARSVVVGDMIFAGPTAKTLEDIESGPYSKPITALAALDVDCSLGNYFTKTVAGNVTLTFSNAPASKAFSFTLEITHTSGAITWPSSVRWPSETAPSLTTGKTHLFGFVTDDSGTTWRGASQINYAN